MFTLSSILKQKDIRRWKPRDGQDYWFIWDNSAIWGKTWHGGIDDQQLFIEGNVFKTFEQAQEVLRRIVCDDLTAKELAKAA